MVQVDRKHSFPAFSHVKNMASCLSVTFPLLAAALIMMLGCSPSTTNDPASTKHSAKSAGSDSEKLRVCCTTGQVADMVRAIGGDQVDVTVLIGPGVDPHSFRASSGDAQRLNAAEVVFYNGLHLEGRLSDILEKLNAKKPTLSLGDFLLAKYPDRIRKGPEFGGAADPHIWFDADLWSQAIPAVTETLTKLRPANKELFAKNAEKYQAELLEIDRFCREQLATIPAATRVLVTAHDAFGYFGKAYQIEVHGLQGISTVDEASLAATNELIKMLIDRKIKAIFVESSVPPERLQQVIDGCKKQDHAIVIGGELYSDALGETGSEAATYRGMMRANVKTIVAALK
jgi:manganese/zinc/iron transport system substrate-binding protein